ncbi:MAG: large subunit ribosomal protein L24 [Chlamydiales bacterium]|jgi:large subunit ribosomal protein L24
MSKIRKGDQVMAISGNEKGRTGSVISLDKDRVLVQGLNVRKKHVKAQRNQKGQIIEIESPIHVSNVRVCNSEGKPVKLKIRENDSGERELYYMDGDKAVTHRSVK